MRSTNIEEKKLPLVWLVFGIIGLITYLIMMIIIGVQVYYENGFLVAIFVVCSIGLFFKFCITPLIIKFLNSRKG
jgi:membrane protein YdbS with pleckstrin-like domain